MLWLDLEKLKPKERTCGECTVIGGAETRADAPSAPFRLQILLCRRPDIVIRSQVLASEVKTSISGSLAKSHFTSKGNNTPDE